MTPGNDWTTIVTFAIIALLILGMACVNFTNLATARASQRAREVALRKVLGANRRQLIAQFLGESVLIARVAMLLALAWSNCCCRPSPPSSMPTSSSTISAANGMLLPVVGLIAAGRRRRAASIPAFYLSRFQPAQVLKANKSSAETPGSGLLRNMLVVAPVRGLDRPHHLHRGRLCARPSTRAPSIPATAATACSRSTNIGRTSSIGSAETIRADRSACPASIAVGRADIGVATENNNNTGVIVPGQAEADQHRQLPDRPASSRRWASSCSPAAASTGTGRWTTCRCRSRDRSTRAQNAPGARAASTSSINRARGPAAGLPQPAGRRSARRSWSSSSSRIRPGADSRSSASSRIRASARSASRSIRSCSAWTATATRPARPLRRRSRRGARGGRAGLEAARAATCRSTANFSDDKVAELYTAERRARRCSPAFALLAVIVACLGLFGLAAFTAERRTKEIGIRKVLGARIARHRPAARLAILQAGDDRQPVRLAGRLVGDARLAEPVRHPHRRWGRRRSSLAGGCSPSRSRSAPSPATPSRSPAPTPSTPCATNRMHRETMWRNYLTVGVRALAKNRTYAFINIFGLAHRPRRLPDDPALRPLRDELRQVDAGRGNLPAPDYYKATPRRGEEWRCR